MCEIDGIATAKCVIGVDFDNTIACYDELMHAIALERGLIGANIPRSKKLIRDAIRRRPDGESAWRSVQVTAYGPRMHEALPIDGVKDFFAECHRRRIPICIVSHKTEFANFGSAEVNLRAAALAWLDLHGFLAPAEFGVARESVFFESTRAEKLERIRAIAATHFIDDLEETFCDDGFPPLVHKLLFAAHGQGAGESGAVPFQAWREIQDHMFAGPDLQALSLLLKKPVLRAERIGRGGNNRVYALTCGDDSRYAAKLYLQPTADGRDRRQVEFSSLSFLWSSGLRCIPRPVAVDVHARLAVYEFIDGSPIETRTVTEDDIEQFAAFAGQLKELATTPQASLLPPASEACFSLHALHENILHRLDRVTRATGSEPSYGRLHDFLSQALRPALESFVARARSAVGPEEWTSELPVSDRTLSPSDMGFHNALRRDDGSIVVLDFEYFGVDDPAKLLSDFLLHPAMELSDGLRRAFVERTLAALGNGERLRTRFELSYPLFGLKWCLIFLNEFVPTHLQRREFASGGTIDREQVRLGQLEKATRLLTRLNREVDAFHTYA